MPTRRKGAPAVRTRPRTAVDATRHPLPLTMQSYAMQGTPTLILIDRQGRLRRKHFGLLDDLRLGAEIATLLAEPPASDQVR